VSDGVIAAIAGILAFAWAALLFIGGANRGRIAYWLLVAVTIIVLFLNGIWFTRTGMWIVIGLYAAMLIWAFSPWDDEVPDEDLADLQEDREKGVAHGFGRAVADEVSGFRTFLGWAFIALIALGVVAAVFGWGDHETSNTPAVHHAGSAPVVPAPTAPDPTIAAERAVKQYYAAIGYYDYGGAWQYLGQQQRAEDGGYKMWRDGQVLNVATNLKSAIATPVDADTATVSIRLNTADLDICGSNVPQTFEGTWTVDFLGGQPYLDSANISKIAGGDPTTDVRDCPPTELPPSSNYSYVPPPTSGGSSSSYESGGSYSAPTVSDFCSIYNCVGDFNNEPGSIVQCSDGSYSHAGGIQGACSSHGGVSSGY
jgi:hypothetical protein